MRPVCILPCSLGLTDKDRSEITPDPMRKLIAQYAASNIESLRMSKEFGDLVHYWGEFARDLIGFVGNGKEIDKSEHEFVLG